MLRRGREVRYRTDYVLGKDYCLLQNVLVWDARHNIDHYLVLGSLREAASTEHSSENNSF